VAVRWILRQIIAKWEYTPPLFPAKRQKVEYIFPFSYSPLYDGFVAVAADGIGLSERLRSNQEIFIIQEAKSCLVSKLKKLFALAEEELK
jgi:hypothetical protein